MFTGNKSPPRSFDVTIPDDIDGLCCRMHAAVNEVRRSARVPSLYTWEWLNVAAQDAVVSLANMYNKTIIDGEDSVLRARVARAVRDKKDWRSWRATGFSASGCATPEKAIDAWICHEGSRAIVLQPDLWAAGFGVATAGPIPYWCLIMAGLECKSR